MLLFKSRDQASSKDEPSIREKAGAMLHTRFSPKPIGSRQEATGSEVVDERETAKCVYLMLLRQRGGHPLSSFSSERMQAWETF